MHKGLTYCVILMIASSLGQQPSSNAEVFADMTCGTEGADLYCHSNEFAGSQLRFADEPRHPGFYETVDLVFDGGRLNVTSPFFESVNSLFKQEPRHKNELRVKFQNFQELNLHDKIFSKLFNKVSPDNDVTLNVYNSKAAAFRVSPQTFDGLHADNFVIHNADMSSIPFQTLFGNSKISTLDLKGTYLNSDESIPFKGYVNKVILTKQASVLNAEEFPRFPVREYIINAQNIQSIDSESFQNYDNIVGLSVKSKLLAIREGDLRGFHNLKRLQLEDVIVEGGSLKKLHDLEELDIGPGVAMRPEAAADIGSLRKLRRLSMGNNEQLTDVRYMCNLATAISQLPDTLKRVDVPVFNEKCTCEHKYLAHLKDMPSHPCYNLEADCTHTSCQAVDRYFSRGRPQTTALATTTDAAKLTSPAAQPLTESYDVRNRTDLEVTGDKAFTTMSSSVSHVGEHPKTRRLSKMNWLPIVIVIAILLFILICGIVAYLIRTRSDKNKQFKPIPSHDAMTSAGSTKPAAAARG